MRVVFLGTPGFAVPSLQALHSWSDPEYQVVGVITQPDRPAGRGQNRTPPAVKVLAAELGIPVYQPERLRDNQAAQEFLEEADPGLMVVVAFGTILAPEFFGYPPLGTLNVHASLLPSYRGATPIVHTLLNGELETGVTIMKIDEGMDTGAIVSQSRLKVGSDTNAAELEEALAHRGAELLIQTIPKYAAGEIQPVAQKEEQASYAPRIGKEEARIDWSWPDLRIHNWVRALNPRPAAKAVFRGKKVKIWRTSRVKESGQERDEFGSPGTILSLDRRLIIVSCGGETCLSVEELQMPNRKRLLAVEFINGIKPEVGESFT
ncbi:MAG: methionyl-tRNA formyltransferase [Acidobacteriota bacterium]|nr:methionyl-tRNA formyltransferase [Acidobacteriota bacterium]